MKFHRTTVGWLPLLIVIMLCSVFAITVLTSGCSKNKKKEKAEFKPGHEWIEDMRTRIYKTIADPEKMKHLLTLVDQVEKDLFELDQAVQNSYKHLAAADSDYNATPKDLQRVFAEFNATRREFRDRFMTTRFQMRDLVTPEEWGKLSDIRKGKGLYHQWQRYPGQ